MPRRGDLDVLAQTNMHPHMLEFGTRTDRKHVFPDPILWEKKTRSVMKKRRRRRNVEIFIHVLEAHGVQIIGYHDLCFTFVLPSSPGPAFRSNYESLNAVTCLLGPNMSSKVIGGHFVPSSYFALGISAVWHISDFLEAADVLRDTVN